MWYWRREEKPARVDVAGQIFEVLPTGKLSPQPLDEGTCAQLRALPHYYEERTESAAVPALPPAKRRRKE